MKTALPLITLAILAACQTAAPPPAAQPESVAMDPSAPAITEIKPSAGEQWLLGSAEARIVMVQSWNEIASYVEKQAASRPNASVILAPGATPDAPEFLACGDKPLAAVFDADETLIWNTGSTGAYRRMGKEYDPITWGEWERTGAGKAVAIPGALDGVARIRAAGVEVIVNTNREAANVEGNIATLAQAGFGEFVHGSTLFLKGDTPGGSAKDARRYAISENYCVVALVGDQLGDIADIFNDKTLRPAERRSLSAASAFDSLWGQGWFILPNPLYGPSIAGSMDDIFPAETYWEPASKD
ncbi:acid phosphatase [Hyphomonas sp. WL0036]|uniref:5'-nucleotidase, lipoprotein e(P4) family n=1 Tax=Hyphomonas sediminis TaxID=2866160 RepID=UPI001C7E2A53|nr:HAD family acid phosphatase [Hyphomonas sediminis]MBY9065514.1 acid phosphatase [Hyphomonas sediminis]